MRPKHWERLLAGLALTAPVPLVVRAEVYLSEDHAAQVLFPDLPLKADWVTLTREESKFIQKQSGERVLFPRVRILWGPSKEALIIDRVVGKHEFITYAVAIQPDGSVKGVEIMEYRETYGHQVRDLDWRKRFVGKTQKDPLQIDQDIPNISGATLSCVHVTGGIRRTLSIYELLKARS